VQKIWKNSSFRRVLCCSVLLAAVSFVAGHAVDRLQVNRENVFALEENIGRFRQTETMIWMGADDAAANRHMYDLRPISGAILENLDGFSDRTFAQHRQGEDYLRLLMEYIDEASIQEKAVFCEVVIPLHVFHHQLKNTHSMEKSLQALEHYLKTEAGQKEMKMLRQYAGA
jgi:hypothetical protein